MSKTMTAIALLIETFRKHATKEGDKHTLTKAEMKDLLQSDFEELLGTANDQAAVDRIFEDLDANKDNTVDFIEFMAMVGSLADMCNKFLEQ